MSCVERGDAAGDRWSRRSGGGGSPRSSHCIGRFRSAPEGRRLPIAVASHFKDPEKQAQGVPDEIISAVSKEVFPRMIERGSGSVIMIGRIPGKRPLWGGTPYVPTKPAFVGLTRTLAIEAGKHGVQVNLISAGFVAAPRLDRVIESQAEGRGVCENLVRRELEEEAALNELIQPEDIARRIVPCIRGVERNRRG